MQNSERCRECLGGWTWPYHENKAVSNKARFNLEVGLSSTTAIHAQSTKVVQELPKFLFDNYTKQMSNRSTNQTIKRLASLSRNLNISNTLPLFISERNKQTGVTKSCPSTNNKEKRNHNSMFVFRVALDSDFSRHCSISACPENRCNTVQGSVGHVLSTVADNSRGN